MQALGNRPGQNPSQTLPKRLPDEGIPLGPKAVASEVLLLPHWDLPQNKSSSFPSQQTSSPQLHTQDGWLTGEPPPPTLPTPLLAEGPKSDKMIRWLNTSTAKYIRGWGGGMVRTRVCFPGGYQGVYIFCCIRGSVGTGFPISLLPLPLGSISNLLFSCHFPCCPFIFFTFYSFFFILKACIPQSLFPTLFSM